MPRPDPMRDYLTNDLSFLRTAPDITLRAVIQQRDLALKVVAAAERRIQLTGTPHEEAAEQDLVAALAAYREHYCRTGERAWPVYDKETGEIKR